MTYQWKLSGGWQSIAHTAIDFYFNQDRIPIAMSEIIIHLGDCGKPVDVCGKTALVTGDGVFHPQFGEIKADISALKNIYPERRKLGTVENGDTFHWESGNWVVVRHGKVKDNKISINFCGSRETKEYCSSCFRRQEPSECDHPVKR